MRNILLAARQRVPLRMLMAATLLLSGCATTTTDQTTTALREAAHNPATSARIRVFGNNGFGVVLYPGQRCMPESSDGGIRVSGSLGQAFGALVGADQNDSIGMPVSERSSAPRNGILAREYFKEYAVPAGQPITLKMRFIGTPAASPASLPLFRASVVHSTPLCGEFGATFFPQGGSDYDIYPVVAGARCASIVARIDENGQDLAVDAIEALRCR